MNSRRYLYVRADKGSSVINDIFLETKTSDLCMQCAWSTSYLIWSGIADAVEKLMYVDIFEKRIGTQPLPPKKWLVFVSKKYW